MNRHIFMTPKKKKLPPGPATVSVRGQTCSHLQSIHTFQDELLEPLFPLVLVVDLTPQLLCVQALNRAAGHCIITPPADTTLCKSSTQPGQKLSLVLAEWNLQTW